MKTDTPETDDFEDGCINPSSFADFARNLERERNLANAALRYASIEIAELRHQIRETIMENLHLADGDDCTLLRLKDAIGFQLDDSSENAKSDGSP